jgi:NAD(P)-dependent dehydrogenase (short-subunit alcohol dehydrogenase family)
MPQKIIAKRGIDAVLGEIPMKRLGAADEVAGVIQFLLGPDSAYVTGQVINVDGGIICS